MNYTEDERAFLWLKACTPFENGECAALLRAAEKPRNLLFSPEKFISAVIKKERRGLYNSERSPFDEVQAFITELERGGYFAITLVSGHYPEALKQIPDPPLVLYALGNASLLDRRKFCVVGSRITPAWAQAQTIGFSKQLSREFAIVTGFAEGGDAAAIDGALDSGNLICVLPCGIDVCYPSSHLSLKRQVAERGLLLSEFPLGFQAQKFSFYARNRILAGMSEGVLVVSAGRRSGTAITASYALDYGKDVYAFPYNLGTQQGVGCNELIKHGAAIVTEVGDILSAYGFEERGGEEQTLSSEEQRVLEVLREEGELHAAVIAERTGLKVYEAAAALSALEMKNLAVKSGGNKYSAI